MRSRNYPNIGLALLLLVLSAVVVFSNAMTNAFHLDDFYRVVENNSIRHIWPLMRHFWDATTIASKETVIVYRPLLPLSFSLDYHFWGLNPIGYHVVNLFLHIGSAFMLLLVLTESIVQLELRAQNMTGSSDAPHTVPALIPLAAALLFVVHPVSGVVVNYICSRDLAMMQLFMLSALYAYIFAHRHFKWIANVVGVLLLGCALCAKSNALVFPLLIVAWEWSIHGTKLFSRSMILRVLPYALVVVAFALWSFRGPGAGLTPNIIDKSWEGLSWPLTEAKLHLFYYARNFVWPWTMRALPEVAIDKELSLASFIGGCAIAASLLVALIQRKRRPLVCFGILAYWIMFLLEGTVIPLYHAAADYRPYAGSGFAFAAVLILSAAVIPARLARPIFIGCLLYIGVASFWLNRHWSSEETLWEQSVNYGTEPIGHMNYALSLPNRRDPRVLSNLEIAAQRNPASVLAHLNLGLLLVDLGQRERALGELGQASTLGASWGITHHFLAIAYEKLGMPAQAEREHEAAANIDVRNIDYNYSLALSKSNAGHPEDAVPLLERLLNYYPHDRDVRFLLGYDLLLLRRYEAAQPIFTTLCREFPDHNDYQYDLGFLYARTGRCQQAQAIFTTVLEHGGNRRAVEENLKLCGTIPPPHD